MKTRQFAWLGQTETDQLEDESIGRYLVAYRFRYIDDEPRVIIPLRKPTNWRRRLLIATGCGLVAGAVYFGCAFLFWLFGR